MPGKLVIFEPFSDAFAGGKMFDLQDPFLNRDDCLLPYARAREQLQALGHTVITADQLLENGQLHHRFASWPVAERCYFSFGILRNWDELAKHVSLKGFFIQEPPIVRPDLYRALPELSRKFSKVFLYNTVGDGYSLAGVNKERLGRLRFPMPHARVLEPHWSQKNRQRRVAVINGNHKPALRQRELYGARIRSMRRLARLSAVDLFGRGWERWWSRNSLWWPYWQLRPWLKSIYRGPVESKFVTLSQYMFSLCYENMEMTDYFTEKIFDCFYAGTVPIYWGASNVEDVIPLSCFIDRRKFADETELWKYLQDLTVEQVEAYRQAARAFLESEVFQEFVHSPGEALARLLATP